MVIWGKNISWCMNPIEENLTDNVWVLDLKSKDLQI